MNFDIELSRRHLNSAPNRGCRLRNVIWLEERRGALVLLAGLADWNGARLRQAAIGSTDSNDEAVRSLLLDAAQVADEDCSPT